MQLFGIIALLVVQLSLPEVDSRRVPIRRELIVNSKKVDNNETDGALKESAPDRPTVTHALSAKTVDHLENIRLKGMVDAEKEENIVQLTTSINYREELRTAVGAMLGTEECLKQAACRAGKYLKNVKGKEIILVILEKLSPETWMETVHILRDAVHQNAHCQYKCFDQ